MKLMAEQTTEEIRQKHIKLDNTCIQKAKARGQMTFTVVEQDATAVETVAEWIKLNARTAPPAKLYEALEFVLAAREFPNQKRAD